MNRTVLLVFITILLVPIALSQTSQPAPGIELYQQGSYDAAIRSLKASTRDDGLKNEPKVWNTLGLAYVEKQEFKNAQKAFDKAVKLAPQNASYRVNLAYSYMLLQRIDQARTELEAAVRIDPKNREAYFLRGRSHLWEGRTDAAMSDVETLLALDPTFASGYVLKSDIHLVAIGNRVLAGSTFKAEVDILRQARDVLLAGLSRTIDAKGKQTIEKELKTIDAFYQYFSQGSRPPGTAPETGVVPIKFLNKPRVEYTNSARAANISGKIRLAVLFGPAGKVEGVLAYNRLGHGLDEQAIRAAYNIKFEPKQVDGKPVATVLPVEYSFSIY